MKWFNVLCFFHLYRRLCRYGILFRLRLLAYRPAIQKSCRHHLLQTRQEKSRELDRGVESICTRNTRPYLRPVCCTPFCFNVLYQFTPLINLRSHIFWFDTPLAGCILIGGPSFLMRISFSIYALQNDAHFFSKATGTYNRAWVYTKMTHVLCLPYRKLSVPA